MKPIFQIAKLVSGLSVHMRRPWFIMETRLTSDGPRTRICDGRWETEEEAQTLLAQKEKDAKNV